MIFQQDRKPRRVIAEAKKYFTEKHKLVGYKADVSIISSERATDCIVHYCEANADADMFLQNLESHKQRIEKVHPRARP